MQATRKALKINIASFDLLKGILIVSVVFIHMFQSVNYWESPVLSRLFDILTRTGYACMPVFWVLSGFGFKEKAPVKLLKASADALCKPCIYAVLIKVLLDVALHIVLQFGVFSEVCQDALAQLLSGFLGLSGPNGAVTVFGITLNSCGPLWFFWSSFVAQNVLNLIVRTQKAVWKQTVLVLLFAAAGYWLMEQDFTFYSIPQGLLALVFYYEGYLLKRCKLLPRLISDVRTYLILIPIYLAEVHWGLVDMWAGVFRNVVLDCIGCGASALLIILAGVWAGQFESKWTDGLKQIGVYSFWVLLAHCVEMDAFPWSAAGERLAAYTGIFFAAMTIARFLLVNMGVFALKKWSKYNYTRRALKSGK